MKKTVFKRKDGTQGEKYFMEPGDTVTADYPSIRETEPRAANDPKTGRAFMVKDAFLGVTTAKGEKITINLTEGQAKLLKQKGDLKGKQITAEVYTAKFKDKSGKQQTKEGVIGLRVL